MVVLSEQARIIYCKDTEFQTWKESQEFSYSMFCGINEETEAPKGEGTSPMSTATQWQSKCHAYRMFYYSRLSYSPNIILVVTVEQ